MGRHHAQAGRDGHRGRAHQLAQTGGRQGRVRRPAVRGLDRQGRLRDPQPVRRGDRRDPRGRRGEPSRSALRWCASRRPAAATARRPRGGEPAAVGLPQTGGRRRTRARRSRGAADGRIGGTVRRGDRTRARPPGSSTTSPCPSSGETVTEGTIGSWLKQAGDAVEMDDALFEVSTDKVDSEIPSPYDGSLLEILVAAGETVPVGTPLARIGEAGGSRRLSPGGAPAGHGGGPARPAAAARAASDGHGAGGPRSPAVDALATGPQAGGRERARRRPRFPEPAPAAGSGARTCRRCIARRHHDAHRRRPAPRPAAAAAPAPRGRRPAAAGDPRAGPIRGTRSSPCPGCGWRWPAA